MFHGPRRRRAVSVAPALLLIPLLYASLPILRGSPGLPDSVAASSLHVRPGALAVSPKPVWRADAANTGRLAAAGPATMPSQVFSQKVPGNSAIVTGEQLDPSGNIVVGDAAGDVYSYAPGGGLNWTATFGAGTGSNNKGSALSPTLGRDGALYAGADDGSVNQINPAALAGGKALACPIFTAPLNGGVRPGITTIAQIDGGNHLLVGDDGGTFYSVTPPAPAHVPAIRERVRTRRFRR